jgi:hypothetical protein
MQIIIKITKKYKIMKRILLITTIFILTLSCKAQIIEPVEKIIFYDEAGKGIPNNYYFKDINHLMDKYLGTWKGTYDNKKYTFIISKYKDSFSSIAIDILIIRYLIVNPDGTILEDTRSEVDGHTRMGGDYFSKDQKSYVLSFVPKDETCGIRGNITVRPNGAQLTLIMRPSIDIFANDECSDANLKAPLFPTKERMTLTKQ